MKDYQNLNKKEILNRFNVYENTGINSNEINKRVKLYGANIIEVEDNFSFIQLYFNQVKSFLNLLLIFLVFFSFALWYNTKDSEYLLDAIIILIIFLFNTLIGAYQNYSSRKIAKTLSSMLETKVVVLRNKEEIVINSKDLVCGDIVLLKGGDRVPADCYLIDAFNLKVDESILTGESISVLKEASELKKETSELVKMTNMIFMNTFIVSGNAKAVVVKVGMSTEMGKIAGNIKVKNKKISFLDEIDDASKTISKFAIGLILLVSIVLLIKGFDIIDIFLIASALIIGSIPEGLPVIVVFLLSKSVHSLAKKKILVKEMGLLETLGSINILCTDKTGTLTTNQMSVKKIYSNFNTFEDFSKLNEKHINIISKIIALANEAELVNDSFKGESEDVALISLIQNNGFSFNKIKKENKITKFEPFSSETKCVIAQSKNIIYKKGAFETIIEDCDSVLKNGIVKKISKEEINQIQDVAQTFTSQALRLIAFSYQEKGAKVFVGFTGLYDKPKEGIKKTILELYSSGIDVKMITGDSKNTAIAIAKECGFKNPKGVECTEIKDLNEEDLKKKNLQYNILARVMPEFKEKIVSILQSEGNRVAITGDGVNDTIALRNSDVGIVMGSGSDIAKESADLILINNDFTQLPLVIKEGRGIFNNIRKVVNYLLTANLAEVLVVFIASFLGIIPFTAIQILWVNFVTDIFPALSLGLDNIPDKIMKEKPTGKDEKILNDKIKLLTLFVSLKKVILIFALYYIALYYSNGDIIFAQTIAFTWLVLTHFVRIAALRFDEEISIFSNKYVIFSILLVLVLQLFLIYTPLRIFFGIVSIPFNFWLLLIGAVVIGVFFARLITLLVNYLLNNKIFNLQK